MITLEEYKAKCEEVVESVMKSHNMTHRIKGPWRDKMHDEDIALFPVHIRGTAEEAVNLTDCWDKKMEEVYADSPSVLDAYMLEAGAEFYGKAVA